MAPPPSKAKISTPTIHRYAVAANIESSPAGRGPLRRSTAARAISATPATTAAIRISAAAVDGSPEAPHSAHAIAKAAEIIAPVSTPAVLVRGTVIGRSSHRPNWPVAGV